MTAPGPLSPRSPSRPKQASQWPYIATLLVAAAVIAGATAWIIEHDRRAAMAYWDARQSGSAEVTAGRVSDWLGERRSDAQVLAAAPAVRALLTAFAPDGSDAIAEPQQLTGYLAQAATLYRYQGAYVLSRDGRIAAQSPGAPVLPAAAVAAARTAAQDGASRIDLLGEVPELMSVSFTAPVFRDDVGMGRNTPPGTATGVVILTAALADTLVPLITQESVPTRTGETVLVRQDGPSIVYFTPLRLRPPNSPQLRVPLATTRLPSRLALMKKAVFGEFTDYRGVAVLAATRYLPLTGWGLVRKIDRAEALSGFATSARRTAFAGVIVILGIAVLMRADWQRRRAEILREQIASAEARLRLATIVDSSDDAIIGGTLDGIITSWNAGAERMYGYGAAEVLGRHISILAPPNCREEVATILAHIKAGEHAKHLETLRLRKDGHSLDVSLTASPIIDTAGTIVGASVIARDVTERTRAERLAAEQGKLSEAFFMHSLTCLVLLDKNFDFVRVNHAYADACRRDIGDFAGRNHFDLYPSDAKAIFEDVVRTKKPFRALARPFVFPERDDRGLTYWDWTLVPILDDHGEVEFLLFSLSDVTERKQAEDTLRKQARLLDLAHDAIFVRDRDDRITYWNPAAEHRYGWSAEEALGQHAQTFLRTVFPEPLPQIEATLLATKYWEGELQHTTRDGSHIIVASRWSLERDDNGNHIATLEINNDITERRRAEHALRLAYAYNRSLIEVSLDPLVTIGPDGTITDVNAATETVTGYSRAQLIGSDFCDYFTEPERARTGYRTVFTEGIVRDYPLTIRHVSGRTTDVLYNATVYRNETGGVQGVFAAARDITERKRAEEQLRALNEQLEQRVHERTAELQATIDQMRDFTYSVSHDLRAPIRHIDGFAQLLRQHGAAQPDERSRHYLDVIARAARHMGQLIDDLLAFARTNRSDLNLERIDLNVLVRDLQDALTPPARQITWDVQHLPVVYADPVLMRCVFANLLGNAIKFTAPRRVAHIIVGAIGGANSGSTLANLPDAGGPRSDRPDAAPEIVLFVRDNGVGFDMNYVHKLFGVFQRLHRTEEFEGTGIGLATARRIIERHGGRVWAVGHVDRGASIYFSLPQRLADATRNTSMSAESGAEEGEETYERQDDFTG